MTNKALQTALNESLGYCAEYRKVIENRDRTIEGLDQKIASQAERIQELEAAIQDRDRQLQRFAEAYKTLKSGLTFYEAQANQAKEQHYQLRKQYETGLEEQKKKLLETFTELKGHYEATAKREIAKAVARVKANERSAEEICRSFAIGLLNDFERALPKGLRDFNMPSSQLGKR